MLAETNWYSAADVLQLDPSRCGGPLFDSSDNQSYATVNGRQYQLEIKDDTKVKFNVDLCAGKYSYEDV